MSPEIGLGLRIKVQSWGGRFTTKSQRAKSDW